MIIQMVEQSYRKIDDIRDEYIKRYGPVEGWQFLQYILLLNTDTEITCFLEKNNITLNSETQEYGVTFGMLRIRNEVRNIFHSKYGTSNPSKLTMQAKEEMYQAIYHSALDYWIHGIEALNN